MYNLIKRALVTIDDNERISLRKKEPADKDKKEAGDDSRDSQDGTPSQEEMQENIVSPAVSLAKEKARVIIEEANNEAKEIKAEAEKIKTKAAKESEKIMKQAEKKAAEKEKQLEKKWNDKMSASTKALKSASEALNKSREEYAELSTEKMRDLIALLSEKILLTTLEEKKGEILEKKVDELMRRVVSLRDIVFKFNPRDFSSFPPELNKKMNETLTSFEIRQDPSVSKGGVVVETSYGTLDASYENQREILKSLIDEVFGGSE